MARLQWNWLRKRTRVILALVVLAVGAALVSSCGEDKLPPAPPPNTGTVTLSGGAV
jgi:hypothetical protein